MGSLRTDILVIHRMNISTIDEGFCVVHVLSCLVVLCLFAYAGLVPSLLHLFIPFLISSLSFLCCAFFLACSVSFILFLNSSISLLCYALFGLPSIPFLNSGLILCFMCFASPKPIQLSHLLELGWLSGFLSDWSSRIRVWCCC